MLQNDERILRRTNELRRRDLPIAPVVFQKEWDETAVMGASKQLPFSDINSSTSSRLSAKKFSMSRRKSGVLQARNRAPVGQRPSKGHWDFGDQNHPRQFTVNADTAGQQQPERREQAVAVPRVPHPTQANRPVASQMIQNVGQAVPPPPPPQFLPPNFL